MAPTGNRFFFRALALIAALAVAAPACAQSLGNGPAAMGGMPARGGFGGPMRGGGIGLGPGALLPGIAIGAAAAAAAASAESEPPPGVRHAPLRKAATAARKPKSPPPPPHLAALNLPPKGETRFVPNELLVVLAPGVSVAQADALARRQKLTPRQFHDVALLNLRVYRFALANGRSLDKAARALAREPAVVSIQPDYVYALAGDVAPAPAALETPAAPSAMPPAYAPAMLHLPDAHEVASGKGVRVALIDSAIDPSHPEIAGSVAASFDASGAPAPPSRHGAGMASAIAGHSRIEGAAPGVALLAARAFDETPQGARAAGFDLLAALDWAVAQKAQIVNMSFAGPADPLLARMLEAAAAKRIVLVAAAGNDGPAAPPAFPGADPHVIAVSAVDDQGRLYAQANRGGYVALAAPGVDVLVAAPAGAYDLTSGTSVACAEVSGIAALILEKQPGLDGPALRKRLRDSAHALKDAPGAGAGLADAALALVEKK
jgi:hypothetical protein